MRKEEFELKVRSLIGEIVEEVFYFEIEYENGEELWNSDEDFDSLDYGFDLVMASGITKGFIWGSEFYQYGVSLLSNSLDSELSAGSKIEVSSRSRWRDLIGLKVENARIIWSWVKEDGLFKKKYYYPQDVILTFEGGKEVLISATEIRDGKAYGFSDNITIVFDNVVSKKYALGS